ncbi:MAG: peptide chain release factor 2 [Candidatus Calescibacterium sp.]|nr:peptide chain release factor 2 [Candidatus Calescibacterium sp.]MCX7972119.1 peptide chain release factor 2 [bacterium]MDW8194807.1 peptide chain release factor 2 [Candidatus Calescibacterium sp.]
MVIVDLKEIKNIKAKLNEYKVLIDELASRLNQLEKEIESSQNPDYNKIKEKKRLISLISRYNNLTKEVNDFEEIYRMYGNESEDLEDIRKIYLSITKDFDNFSIELLLSEEYDDHDAILTITAGAGGTDAQDWAQMLMRMYIQWAEKHKFSYQITDIVYGQEAGIKSCEIIIKSSYGYLKSEKGVHRLVRTSPFNAQNKRHTSFALVEVIPRIDENINIEIRPEDLKVETFKAGGAGGQHVNKNESAVRITHLPTGIVVTCSNERSQHQNKEIALKILKSKIYDLEKQKLNQKVDSFKTKQQAAWGNQIRSYVLHPYKLIKDLRTNTEIYKVEEVLNGDLDKLILDYLLYHNMQKKQK